MNREERLSANQQAVASTMEDARRIVMATEPVFRKRFLEQYVERRRRYLEWVRQWFPSPPETNPPAYHPPKEPTLIPAGSFFVVEREGDYGQPNTMDSVHPVLQSFWDIDIMGRSAARLVEAGLIGPAVETHEFCIGEELGE